MNGRLAFGNVILDANDVVYFQRDGNIVELVFKASSFKTVQSFPDKEMADNVEKAFRKIWELEKPDDAY